MATINTTSSPTPEYVSFQKCLTKVILFVQSQPMPLANKLFEKNCLPQDVFLEIGTPSWSDAQKAQRIVNALILQIQNNPKVYHHFVDILKEDSFGRDLFGLLQEHYEKEAATEEPTLPDQGFMVPTPSNDDPSFACSCGKCTIDQFFSDEGCLKEQNFPYLNVTKLSQEAKEKLEAELLASTKKIIFTFLGFSSKIKDSFQRRKVDVSSVKYVVLNLQGFTEGIGVKVLDENDETEIKRAANISEIFITLCKYISFFNFNILERLITEYGSQEDNKLLQEYAAEFNTFCTRNIFEIPPKVFSFSSRPTAKLLCLKCTEDMHAATLETVIELRARVAEVFGLEITALQLSTISKGCVEFHFLLSARVYAQLFPISPLQHSQFAKIGVKVLPLQTTCVQTKPNVKRELGASFKDTQIDPGVKWTAHTGKTIYGAAGPRDVLLLAHPTEDMISDDSHVVISRKRYVLSEKDKALLKRQSVPERCHISDVAIMTARYMQDIRNKIDARRVLWTTDTTCEEALERITRLITTTKNDGGMYRSMCVKTFSPRVYELYYTRQEYRQHLPCMHTVVLHYIGPGKKETGDWCFSNGFVSFRDIMKIYTKNYKGRVLTIVSDCSYSGNWLREAMAYLDEHGVGPCGHVAKEKSILLKVYASCQPDEIPAEFAFSSFCAENNLASKEIRFQIHILSLSIAHGQKPSGLDFTAVRCRNTIDQPCTLQSGYSWKLWTAKEENCAWPGKDKNTYVQQ